MSRRIACGASSSGEKRPMFYFVNSTCTSDDMADREAGGEVKSIWDVGG